MRGALGGEWREFRRLFVCLCNKDSRQWNLYAMLLCYRPSLIYVPIVPAVCNLVGGSRSDGPVPSSPKHTIFDPRICHRLRNFQLTLCIPTVCVRSTSVVSSEVAINMYMESLYTYLPSYLSPHSSIFHFYANPFNAANGKSADSSQEQSRKSVNEQLTPAHIHMHVHGEDRHTRVAKRTPTECRQVYKLMEENYLLSADSNDLTEICSYQI